MDATRSLFCFGFGYTAAALARHLANGPEPWRVTASARTPEKAAALKAQGIGAVVFDGTGPLVADALDGITHVLVSIPPGDGDPVLAHARAALEAARPRWIGYLSTTGVYGNRDGAWVDEGSALRPTSERARRRVAAELDWLRFGDRTGLVVQVFRLAGIYGPGRSAFDQLRAGTARRIDKPGHVFSRIHVDDIAAVLAAAMARPVAGEIYNVCDDEAAEPRAVIEHAAGLLGVPLPPLKAYGDAVLSPIAQSFWADSKRVRNDRLKRALGVVLRYPTYREGLAAILAAEA
jgi:nucleoside-diphosphate-sugar epimerase